MTMKLIKKALASTLAAVTALAAGPVPQALAQVRGGVEVRTGSVEMAAPALGQNAPDLGLNSGSFLSPDLGAGLGTLPALPDTALPRTGQDNPSMAIPAAAPSLAQPALSAVGAALPETAGRTDKPGASAPRENAVPRGTSKADAAAEDASPEKAQARKELLGLRDAVASFPSPANLGLGQAYVNGAALADLLARQKSRTAAGDVAAPSELAFGDARSPLAPALSEAASARLQDLIPLPREDKDTAPARRAGQNARRFAPLAMGFTGLLVVAGLILAQAYLPAIVSSLTLMALAGPIVEGDGSPSSDPKGSRWTSLLQALSSMRPALEAAGIIAAGVGLSVGLFFGLNLLPWAAAALGVTTAIGAYVGLKFSPYSAADLAAVFSRSSLKTGLTAAAPVAAGATATALLLGALAVTGLWPALLLGAAASSVGLSGLLLTGNPMTWKTLIGAGAVGAVGIPLAAVLVYGLAVAPWLAGLIGLGGAAAAVLLPQTFAQGARGWEIPRLARSSAGLVAGAGVALLISFAIAALAPWLGAALGAAAALAGFGALRSQGFVPSMAAFRDWKTWALGASVLSLGTLAALTLIGLSMAPWLAGLLGMGMALGGVFGLALPALTRRAATSAAASEASASAKSLLPEPVEGPVDPELAGKVRQASAMISRLRAEIGNVIIGQESMVDYVIMALLSGQHILLEGVPGVAKTTAVKGFASATGADFQRIQGTPDKMPADIFGAEIMQEDPATGTRSLVLRRGPIFARVVLFDEVNRAPAKTQAALLESMQERQVTIGRETMPLPKPFLLLATQNPIEHEGVYPLTQAAQDRFMFKVIVGMPTNDELVRIMRRPDGQATQVTSIDELMAAGELAKQIRIDPSLEKYIANMVEATHDPSLFDSGLKEIIQKDGGASPRAAIFLRLGAKVRALMEGREYVTPDDIRAIAPEILRHRIRLSHEAGEITPDQLIQSILKTLPIDAAKAEAMKTAALARQARAAALEAAKRQPETRLHRWTRIGLSVALKVLKWGLILSPLWGGLLIWALWPTLTAHFPVLNDWAAQARGLLGR